MCPVVALSCAGGVPRTHGRRQRGIKTGRRHRQPGAREWHQLHGMRASAGEGISASVRGGGRVGPYQRIDSPGAGASGHRRLGNKPRNLAFSHVQCNVISGSSLDILPMRDEERPRSRLPLCPSPGAMALRNAGEHMALLDCILHSLSYNTRHECP